MIADRLFALTSLSPFPSQVARQRSCIDSWRSLGLEVRAFQHPREIDALAASYDVDFVPVERTSADVFGGHFVPLQAILEWARDHDLEALLINADIELRLSPWDLRRIRSLSQDGLCIFLRHNHDGDPAKSVLERHGIDAFLFRARDMERPGASFLSMGQPFWDYWLPHLRLGKRLHSVEFPAAFHRNHQQRWAYDTWLCCAREFARLVGVQDDDLDPAACGKLASATRTAIDEAKVPIPARPPPIREWVVRHFGGAGPRLLLDLRSDHAENPPHLDDVPGVTRVSVEGSALDSFAAHHSIERVDLLWADVGRGTRELIRHGLRTLACSEYLYMSYVDDESSPGDDAGVTLSVLAQTLPQFRIIELWPRHVLLENRTVRRI